VTGSIFVPKTGTRPYPRSSRTAGHSLDGKAAELYQRVGSHWRNADSWYWRTTRPARASGLSTWIRRRKIEAAGRRHGEHSMAARSVLLTGTNIARWFIWDGIRAVDYLETRADVDPKRIAVAGNSGGGTQSAVSGCV